MVRRRIRQFVARSWSTPPSFGAIAAAGICTGAELMCGMTLKEGSETPANTCFAPSGIADAYASACTSKHFFVLGRYILLSTFFLKFLLIIVLSWYMITMLKTYGGVDLGYVSKEVRNARL